MVASSHAHGTVSKRWRNAGLYALLAVILITIVTAFIPQRGQSDAPQPLRYSDFIDQVEANPGGQGGHCS